MDLVNPTGDSIPDVSDDELFNDGMCWFEPTGKEHEFICIMCKNFAVSMSREKILILRPCQSPKTRLQIIYDNEIKIPGIVKRLGNFGIAYLKHIARGFGECSKEEVIYRYDICNCKTGERPMCIYFNPKEHVCSICGCNVNDLIAIEGLNKLAWKDSECPKGFWNKIK
jgi:hypothetical protein